MKLARLSRLVLVVLLGGMVVAACLACMTGVWLAARTMAGAVAAERGPWSNRIVFVGNDGNLWLASPYGEQLESITTDARGYRFPTWAPDGRSLAYVGPAEAGTLALYVFDGEEESSRILYNRPGSAPFYIYWSPDSHSVTFLTQEASSLAMRLADADDPDADRVMAQGSPFYWAWSPDGDQVFMHVGGARVFSKDAHLSLLGNQEGSPRIQLKFPPGQFQAPVWSASGDSVLYIGSNDVGMDAIYRTDMTTSRQTLVTAVSGPACMVLAPDDGHIAYLEARSAHQLPALGSAYIIDKEGERKRRVFNGGVAAMYWSPDGKKLALLTLTQGDEGPTARAHGLAAGLAQPVRYRWWVYDIEEETIQLLTSFVPTQEFMQTVPYFDQYHMSLTFWSPDGRYFVVTKRTAGARDGSVWVLDSTGQESPRQVGEGTFAVWSWQ